MNLLPDAEQTQLLDAAIDFLRNEAPVNGGETPQAFRARDLLVAYRRADADGFTGSDTAACLEAYADLPIAAVPGDRRNLKVTFAEDVPVAERLLASLG